MQALEPWRISLAPMVGQSTRQMRYLWRQLCSSCLLYTEMIPVQTLLRKKTGYTLDYSPIEKPLALQIAGNIPADLAAATKLALEWHYDEINLNVGCPSCKLSQSGLGAEMIKQPQLTADCVAAMVMVAKPAGLPVTVKTRLGADDWDDDDKLHRFINLLQQAGVSRIIIHARKAWLQGLNPRQNRNAPPLQYERVLKIQQAFPDLPITVNGGITNMNQLDSMLQEFGSVMIGRWAYGDPLILREIAQTYWGEDDKNIDINELIKRQLEYASNRWQQGEEFRLSGIHLLNLGKGFKGARHYRQELSSILQNKEPPSFAQVSPYIPSSH